MVVFRLPMMGMKGVGRIEGARVRWVDRGAAVRCKGPRIEVWDRMLDVVEATLYYLDPWKSSNEN